MEQGIKCFLTAVQFGCHYLLVAPELLKWIIMTEKLKFEILTNLNIFILRALWPTVWTVQL